MNMNRGEYPVLQLQYTMLKKVDIDFCVLYLNVEKLIFAGRLVIQYKNRLRLTLLCFFLFKQNLKNLIKNETIVDVLQVFFTITLNNLIKSTFSLLFYGTQLYATASEDLKKLL